MIFTSISKGKYHSIKRVYLPTRHTFRFSAAVIMSIVYDYEVAPDRDHLVELFERGNTLALQSLTPEASAFSFRKRSPFLQRHYQAD